jgi:hypothetical protein
MCPTHLLPEGTEEIDGVRFEFLRFIDAESALQLVAIMPEQRSLLAFDLAFGPNEHVFELAPVWWTVARPGGGGSRPAATGPSTNTEPTHYVASKRNSAIFRSS